VLSVLSVPFVTHRPPPRIRTATGAAYEERLLEEFQRTRDPRLRDELIERHLPLARRLAGRYGYSEEPFDDLLQVACVGLIKAIDRFEPGRGAKLSSFAVPTILGELKRHFRDKTWALHVPRGLQDLSLKLTRENERLAKTLGRSPTVAELSEATGLSAEQVLDGQSAGSAYGASSLDEPVDAGEGDSAPLIEMIGRDDDQFALVEDRLEMVTAWRELPPVQREVLRLRFIEDLTQREIGERIGYSQMHVSRLLRQALATLADI
jgi:RNA polymerase sigma-B factor